MKSPKMRKKFLIRGKIMKLNDHGYELVEVQRDYIEGLEKELKMMRRLVEKASRYLELINEDIREGEKNGNDGSI